MHIAIVGSRDYPDMQKVVDFVYSLPTDVVIVSGGARGVDSVAEKTALERGMRTLVFKADWERLGRSAGYIRNKQIVLDAHEVVAFWDGKSRGTKHTIDLAIDNGVSCRVIFPDPEGFPGG